MNESEERETKTAQRHEMKSKYLNWSICSLRKRFCEKPLKPRTVFSIEVSAHLSGETRPGNKASRRGTVVCILEHASLSVHTSGWLLALWGNPDMLGSVVCTLGELTAWIPGPSSLDAELTSPPEDSKGHHCFKNLPAYDKRKTRPTIAKKTIALPLPNSYQVNLLRFCFIRNHDMCPKRFYIATTYQSDMQFQAVFPFCTLAFTLKEEHTVSF